LFGGSLGVNVATRNIDRLFARAVQHHRAGQLRDAESLYRDILSADPRHINSLYNAGLIGVQVGRPEVAVDLIGKAIALNDDIPHWHYNIAFALRALGRLDEAIAHYRKAVALKPDYAEAHMNLGNALNDMRRLDEAAACYARVIALDARSVEAQYNFANVCAAQEKWGAAAAAYERALALKPDFAAAANNLGIVLAAQGRTEEAIGQCQRVLALDPNLVEAYVNLGKALAEQGRFDDAVAQYRQAIARKPDHAQARNNLGVALMAQGRIEEAIAAYRDAIARDGGLAETHDNLGIALRALGESDAALQCHRRALAAKPDSIEAHNNIARILIARQATIEALDVLECALDIRATAESKMLVVECLKSAALIPDSGAYRELVRRAMVEPWGRPSDVASVAARLVLANREISAAVARAKSIWPDRRPMAELLQPCELAAVCQEPLLRALLEAGCVPDEALERFLTLLRFALLDRAAATSAEDAVSPDELELFAALARLCFLSDYVLDCTADESAHARALGDRLAAAFQAGSEAAPIWPLAVAAYMPLHSFPAAASLLARSWPAAVESVLDRQVRESVAERQHRESIAQLTPIANDVSVLVERQYVENPYPRWVEPAPADRPIAFDDYLRRLFPAVPFRPLGKRTDVDILIAGCGTGRHAVEVARRLEGTRLLAVDLSRVSLGYARHRTLALGVDNIEFGQADILELASLGRSFDIIEAVGSLQTLADPRTGWRVLSSLLRPGGFIFFGLYSEIARRDIVAARNFIAQRGYDGSADDIRRCRQELMDFPRGTPLKNVTHTTEFYNTSECRDLLFHVQEHRTTLAEIKTDLADHGLAFVGFEIDAGARRLYAERFPGDKAMTDLDCWHALETDHPLMFVGMYQFWAQRSP
jgi:tetratricopeptide (TPR) repeat protein/SAM-dependent methyltransferase